MYSYGSETTVWFMYGTGPVGTVRTKKNLRNQSTLDCMIFFGQKIKG